MVVNEDISVCQQLICCRLASSGDRVNELVSSWHYGVLRKILVGSLLLLPECVTICV